MPEPTLFRWPLADESVLARAAFAVVLVPEGAAADPLALVAAGARAVIAAEEELGAAREAMAAGGSYLSPAVSSSVESRSELRPRLGPREVETLRYLVSGLTHRQTARQLGVTEETVNTYAKRLRRKLGAGNKAELTRRAAELGYVQP